MHKKTIIAGFIISVFVISAFAGLQTLEVAKANFFPDPGPDLPRICIRNDGRIDPATAPIARTGNIYKLVGDITLNTIEVQRDNIVLDGAGHMIQGNASWMGTVPRFDDAGNNGVIIDGRSNITIIHLTIEKFATGVRIFNSSKINVIDNRFADETAAMYTPLGVAIRDSSFVLVENNTFVSITGSAIACNGTKNTISGNIIANVSGSIYGNIHLEGSSNLVSNNKIEAMLPITLDDANSNALLRNEISGPKTSAQGTSQESAGSEGIRLGSNCSNNLISGNYVTGFVNQAIRTVFSCTNNTVFGNYLGNNGFAVALQDGAVDNLFYGNVFAVDSCKVQIDDGVVGTRWDNGTAGNFWGDYNGTDRNGDGIGDAPYTVYGFKWDQNVSGFVSRICGQDNHPLVKSPLSPTSTPSPQSPNLTPSSSPTQQPSPTPDGRGPPIGPDDNRYRNMTIIIIIVAIISIIGAVLIFLLYRSVRKKEA